jgi:hypothetical protein
MQQQRALGNTNETLVEAEAEQSRQADPVKNIMNGNSTEATSHIKDSRLTHGTIPEAQNK